MPSPVQLSTGASGATATRCLPSSLRLTCFSVVASADPGVMPRVIQVFAKRGLVPHRWFSTIALAGESLHMDLHVADLDAQVRDSLARALRQIVAVETVLTSESRVAERA